MTVVSSHPFVKARTVKWCRVWGSHARHSMSEVKANLRPLVCCDAQTDSYVYQ